MGKKIIITTFCAVFILKAGVLAANTPTSSQQSSSIFIPRDFFNLLNMKGWDRNLLLMHFTLYQGYVTNTNKLLKEISLLEKSGQGKSYDYGALKRCLSWEFDGMRLHELYFENLTEKAVNIPIQAKLLQQIQTDFGSFDAWKQDFIDTGLIRGIGWAILYKDRVTNKLYNAWVNEHNEGHLAGGIPLLVMDVFEHAYITQFGLDRQKYIDLFFQNIHWPIVFERWQSQGELPTSLKSTSDLQSQKDDDSKGQQAKKP